MKVFVVEKGCCPSEITGVFLSLEAAKASQPLKPGDEWKATGTGAMNSMDLDRALCITSYEVDDE